MNFNQFKESVQQWADSKKINNPDTQILKYLEEKGEFAKAVLSNDRKAIQDELGDLFVVGVIYFWQFGVDYKLIGDFESQMYESKINLYLISLDGIIYTTQPIYFKFLININNYYGFDLEETLQNVFNKISNRTGKTVDGCFIKD